MHFPIKIQNFDLIFLKYKKMELSVFAYELFIIASEEELK
jgi:hypothetical protein